MSTKLESHLGLFEPHEWRLMLKMSALYAQEFGARILSGSKQITRTGDEIVSVTLARMMDGSEGYAFRDGDILFYYCLCRCCRRTVFSLQRDDVPGPAILASPIEHDDDTPVVLTESAAVAFLERRKCLDVFLAFVKDKKLKGKQRAYSVGFAKYGAEGWEIERIAKDLRVTPATIGKYRSQLRGFLEEFELLRARSGSA